MEKKRGLSKYVSKVRAVLRRESKTPAAPPVTETEAGPSASQPPPGPETAAPPRRSPPPPEQEKAQKLAERYGIELEPEDWIAASAAERVEKPIRMRIHRTCHCCKTAFGSNKVCVNCSHVRCDMCHRYPKKKLPGDKGKGVPAHEGTIGVIAETSLGVEGLKRKHKYILTIPSKTGGQDLIRKKPVQRVRRTCHLCQTAYQSGSKTCAQCHHIRCSDCPRDPAKPHKYPYGYPGDVPAPDEDLETTTSRAQEKPARVARYHCHACSNIFRPREQTCSSCGHSRCADCPRVAPKKVRPDPDPDVVDRVRERLAALAVVGSTTVAEPPPKG